MSKRRRYDEQLNTDNEISDFLDSKPELYKQIQLSCFLEKFPLLSNIDSSSPKNFCISILNNIKHTIHLFFPELEMHSEKGDFSIISSEDEDNGYHYFYEKRFPNSKFTAVGFWVYGYNDDEPSEFYKISDASFDKYFSFLSEKLSQEYNSNIKIFLDRKDDYEIRIEFVGY